MKKLLVLFGTMALVGSIAVATPATPCAEETLDNYIVSGFSCSVDNLLFSDFSYVGSGVPVTDKIPASGITVDPLTTLNDEGFSFSGAIGVNSGAQPVLYSQDVDVSFLVSTLDGSATINDLFIGFNGAASGTGEVDFTEKYCPGATTVTGACSGNVFSVFNPAGPVSNHITFAGVSQIAVDKDVQVSTQGGAGRATVSNFDNRYSQSNVPEPGTWLTLGTGLLGAGLMKWRRKV